MNTNCLRQILRMVSVLLGLCLLSACSPDAPTDQAHTTVSADSVTQGRYWRNQALNQILPAWTNSAQTPEGLFYAELDRSWTPEDSTTQYPGMLARHLYSYSVAYLMSGNDAHLEHADAILDFLVAHGWDGRHGGWYNAVSRSGEVVDADKDLFMQIYATTGLALYYIATRDERAETYLRRSRQFMQEHAWDEQNGGYVDVLNRDGSVQKDVKDFSPQLAPVSGYLLYLYPATRDSTYLRMAERIMELTLRHMQDDRGWIRERFAKDWTFLPNDSKNSHLNVGHNVEVAWLLLRLHALTGSEKYRREGLALTDQLLEHAFRAESGAWIHKLKRTDISEYSDEAVWWVQAYGNMLQLYAYRTTGEERYLDAFRKGARFWNEAFVDDEHGATVLRTTLDGAVTGGAKAVRTKTSYHAMEHALLNYLYLDLWRNDVSVTLHYHLANVGRSPLYPLPVEDTPHFERVVVNGSPLTSPDTSGAALRLSRQGSGPTRITVDMTSDSASQ